MDGTSVWAIYESGVFITSNSAATSDVFSIKYDGQWVRYYRNGSVIREVSAPGLSLFFDSSFNLPGSVASDVTFGPLTAVTPSMYIARGNCKPELRRGEGPDHCDDRATAMSGIEIEAKDVASWLGGLATLAVVGLWRKVTNAATREELKELVEKLDKRDERAEASRTRMYDKLDEQSQAFGGLAREVAKLPGQREA